MLLCVDVGNTNTVMGLFQDKSLAAQWRIETAHGRTYDEYAVLLRELFALNGIETASPQAQTLEQPNAWFGAGPDATPVT